MTDTSSSAPQPKAPSKAKWFIENVISLGIALILVFMVRSTLIEAFKIPSGSMIPTLLIGDHIFVNKFAYGFKVPFTEWFGDPIYFTKQSLPERGDIIVFKYPIDEKLYYIKRVIGLPGEKIEMKNKRIFVNDQPIPTEPLPEAQVPQVLEKVDDADFPHKALSFFVEKHTNESPTIMHDAMNFRENFGPIEVPPGSIFVMGDNRDHSNDSRIWGFVPMQNIKGKAIVIWLSLWIDFDTSKFIFRPSRIGNVLH